MNIPEISDGAEGLFRGSGGAEPPRKISRGSFPQTCCAVRGSYVTKKRIRSFCPGKFFIKRVTSRGPPWAPAVFPWAPDDFFIIFIQLYLQNSQKHKNIHETGRRGSKINISGIKMHHVSCRSSWRPPSWSKPSFLISF